MNALCAIIIVYLLQKAIELLVYINSGIRVKSKGLTESLYATPKHMEYF